MMTALATATPDIRDAVDELLLSLADDEFVIGFSDSEWTGIAPLLEEDVAISSIAQDDLGHAKAFYELLVELRADGRDADAIAYDRTPEEYRHCRLLDHPRGDWAHTIVRRFLYETADAVRLEALADSSYPPLRELVGKVQREERYHRMHVDAWFERLSKHAGDPRRRVEAALASIGRDAGTVFTTLVGDDRLVEAGVLARPMRDLYRDWRALIEPRFRELGLRLARSDLDRRSRRGHSDAFRWLHGEFTMVRRTDPSATW